MEPTLDQVANSLASKFGQKADELVRPGGVWAFDVPHLGGQLTITVGEGQGQMEVGTGFAVQAVDEDGVFVAGSDFETRDEAGVNEAKNFLYRELSVVPNARHLDGSGKVKAVLEDSDFEKAIEIARWVEPDVVEGLEPEQPLPGGGEAENNKGDVEYFAKFWLTVNEKGLPYFSVHKYEVGPGDRISSIGSYGDTTEHHVLRNFFDDLDLVVEKHGAKLKFRMDPREIHEWASETERQMQKKNKKRVPMFKASLKFEADFDLVPSNSRDLPEGYLQLEGVEDPGSSAPGGMGVQDWVIYRANWLAAMERFPEGGSEGEAAFIKEHPGEEYPGDVVYDNDFINIYKGAASRVNEANELVEDLQGYPVIDEGKQSEIEDEALNEEIDSWAMDDAKDKLGYDQDWAEVMTDEEAGWLAGLADTNPAQHTEMQQTIDAIFELTPEKEQLLRPAVRVGLTYGDWTVVHLEPMLEDLNSSLEGKMLADPVATMHQFVKSQMQEQVPGTKEYQTAVEERGQQRLFESLRGARQVVVGQAEIRALVASARTVRAAMAAAAPVAQLVGGHQPAEAYGSAFFTYPVKGRLMACTITAFPDQTFGAAWAPLATFRDAEQAASVLAGTCGLSFEAGTKAELVAQIMATVDPVQDYQGHMGTNVLCAASRVRLQMWAKTPKGYEPVVRELKKSKSVDNPWAVAWSMKNKGIRPKASANPVPAIESILANDEASTDEELVQHFMSEMKLPEAEARSWVARRNDYLKGVVGYYIGGHFIEARGRSRVKGAIKAIGNEDIPGYEPKEDEPEGKFSIEDVDDAESPGDFTDEDGEHDVAEVAGWWHGGQFTELYKLSSSGTFDSIDGLVAEIKSNVKEGDDSEGNGLNFLLDWAEAIRKASGEKS